MKAIVYDEYGPPDVLRLAEVAVPAPKQREILIEVRAAAANPLDWHFIRGEPFVMRMFGKPQGRIPGADAAGVVTAVGPGVTRFRIGDEVFGRCRDGAFAQYVCAKEDELAHKPAAVSFDQAAAIPVAACTALQGLRAGRARPGESVLVNGASGGIGTFAVQLAKALEAEVTGVCSTRNLDLVRSIGADHVVDYTVEDFTRQPRRYDLILGVAGNVPAGDMRRALAPGGRLVILGGGVGRDPTGGITVPGMLALAITSLVSRLGKQRVRMLFARISKEDLEYVAGLAVAGKLTPVIGRSYGLADAAQAVRDIEAGHARGKVIVTP